MNPFFWMALGAGSVFGVAGLWLAVYEYFKIRDRLYWLEFEVKSEYRGNGALLEKYWEVQSDVRRLRNRLNVLEAK